MFKHMRTICTNKNGYSMVKLLKSLNPILPYAQGKLPPSLIVKVVPHKYIALARPIKDFQNYQRMKKLMANKSITYVGSELCYSKITTLTIHAKRPTIHASKAESYAKVIESVRYHHREGQEARVKAAELERDGFTYDNDDNRFIPNPDIVARIKAAAEACDCNLCYNDDMKTEAEKLPSDNTANVVRLIDASPYLPQIDINSNANSFIKAEARFTSKELYRAFDAEDIFSDLNISFKGIRPPVILTEKELEVENKLYQ